MSINQEKAPERLVLYLPAGAKAELRQAAIDGGLGERGMSEEARRRLEESFQQDRLRPSSRHLGALVTSLAENATDNFGYWGQDAYSYQVLRHAVRLLLEPMDPGGKPRPSFNPEGLADLLFSEKDTPESIARTLVAVALTTTKNIRGAKP